MHIFDEYFSYLIYFLCATETNLYKYSNADIYVARKGLTLSKSNIQSAFLTMSFDKSVQCNFFFSKYVLAIL